MNRVLKQLPPSEPITVVSNADPNKYYGIELWHDKGFILRKEYKEGSYTGIAADLMTQGNSWDGINSESLPETITNALDAGFSVFEFETSKELFAWLSK